MKSKKLISRKTFLKQVLTILLIPLIILLNAMVSRSKKYGLGKKSKEIPANLTVGISFFEEVIVAKESSGDLKMFSSKCPHLGCRINKMDKGVITCPCHGSTFNPDGSIIKGPAANSLKELNFELNETGNYIVEINT